MGFVFLEGARGFFKGWYFWTMHSRLEPVIKVAEMFNNHLERILTYFRLHATNSIAEGVNTKVEAIKRKAQWLPQRPALHQRDLFPLRGGLELYPL